MITVTPAALSYIRKMMAKESGNAFRVSIKKTGCSGYSYVPSIVQTGVEKDVLVTIENIAIFIDAVSPIAPIILGVPASKRCGLLA